MPEIDKIKIKETTYDIKDTTARNQGLPSGGTTDQILKKKSNTDYDTEWGSISTSWGDITGMLSDQADLQDALDNKADVIVNSASGSIVSIPDAKASPVVGLTIGIEPAQSGSGDPSPNNVRPISGWTEAKITRTGKNILEPKFYNGIGYNASVGTQFTLTDADNVTQSGNTYSRNVASWQGMGMLSPKLPAGTYTLKAELTSTNMRSTIYTLNGDLTVSRNLGNQGSGTSRSINSTITLSGSEKYIAFDCLCSGAGTVTISVPQIELGSSATDFEAYTAPTEVTIDLGGTVYGGTVDFKAGTLTVTHGIKVFDSTLQASEISVGSSTTLTYNQCAWVEYPNIGVKQAVFLSDRFKTGQDLWGFFPSNTAPRCFFGVRPDMVTKDAVLQWFAENPTTLVYPLATPIVITGLTPATLNLLYGTNTLWADTGDINIQYKIDTKEYIDNSRTYYVKGTQTASTGNWTGDLLQIKELYEGLAIDYWLPFAGSGNATLTLTLKNGTTGPIPVYYGGTNRVTTTQPVNTVWRYVYQTVEINNVEYTGWWAVRAYDSNTTYNYFSNLVHNRGKFIADSDINRYNILFHIDDDTLTPLNNANNSTATTKTMLTNVAFDPFAEIFYYGSSGSFSANEEVAASYLTWNHENVDLRYTLNSGSTLTADKYIYLKVIMQSDGKCKLASDPCWTQTLPSTADGYHYIFLGRAHSTTSISFYYYHPVFYHDGTSIKIMQNPKIAGSGGGTWGSISGTLSNQTDLQAALDSKATTTELDNYLPLSGGTMTGNINYQISTIDSTSTPASTINEHIFYILDSNGKPIGNIESSLNDNGEVMFKFGAVRNVNDTNIFNNITCRIYPDGSTDYWVKNPAAFRDAIEATDIAIRPDYIISTVDLTDGVSQLEDGKIYFYYGA